MARRLGVSQITILRAQLVTSPYGDTVPDWTQPPTQTVVQRCEVQPGTTQEYLMNRDNVLVAWTVFAPAGTDVTEFDRVQFNGRTYEVYGHPAPWASPSGRMNYVEIVLKDWSG